MDKHMGAREGWHVMSWHGIAWDDMAAFSRAVEGSGLVQKEGGPGGGNRTLEEGEAKLAAYDDGGRRGWSAYPDGWMNEHGVWMN
ncbi:unnamed protein product [Sphagnum troendelagicum]|uniref:Uncharacterized protein n=1 Tax=Sphagnum troendelagicum TaxID=128251 RepID=A0ABP0UVA3_9BRYO